MDMPIVKLPIGADLDDVMPRDDGNNGEPIEEYETEVSYVYRGNQATT